MLVQGEILYTIICKYICLVTFPLSSVAIRTRKKRGGGMKELLLQLLDVLLNTCLIVGSGMGLNAYVNPQYEMDISPDSEFVIPIALN